MQAVRFWEEVGMLTNTAKIKTEQLQILMDLAAEENSERILSSKGLQTKITSFKERWMEVAEMITSEKNNLTINGLLVTKTNMSLKHWKRYSLILEESLPSGKLCLNISQQNTTLTPKTTRSCDTWLMQGEEIFRDVAEEDLKVKSSVPLPGCNIQEPPWTDSLYVHIRGIAICRLMHTYVPKQLPKKKG